MTPRLLTNYTRWVVRHRRTVVAAILLLTLLLARATTRLHVEIDPDRQLPQDHPFIQALNDVHRIFGDKNLVVIGLFPHDGNVFTPAFLKKLAEVTDAVRRLPGANPALVQSLAAPQVKDIRGTEDGMEVERVMETPPTDEAGTAEVRRRAFATDAYVGTLVAADGSAAAVQASFELTPETPGYRHLHTAVLAALKACDDGTFDYRLSGPVVFLSQLSAYAGRMILYFPLALLVIGLVHYEAFRTLQALFLPLLTALLSVLWAVGLMGLLGVPLDPFNTTTPILILAVAAGHAVQVLKRFYEEFDRTHDVEAAITESLARVGPVMIAAGTIAALSFCSLVTFRTASIRTFGLFTGFGILSALAIELTIIPAVRAMLPTPRRREREREAAAHPWLDAFLGASARAATGRGARRATRALTAQYLFLYTLAGGADDFDTLLDSPHRVAKVRLLVHEDSTRYGERLIALARDQVAKTFPPGYRVRYSGSLASTAAATEVMVHGKVRNIAQIALITIAIASLLLRSVVGGLLVAMPLGLTVAVNFGVMGLLGIPLDTITSAISAMAVGIGADSAIYFLFRVREELAHGGKLEDALGRALMTSGKAVFFVSSAIAFGYATICLSGFGLDVQLGSLVALAMLVSSGSALLLLPAVIARFRPPFLWGGFVVGGRERAIQGAAAAA